MKQSTATKLLLTMAGLAACTIGLALLLWPVTFERSAGIYLDPNNVNLLSELRAPGGLIFTVGTLILSGLLFSKMRWFALQLTTLFYLSYGVSRLIAILLDGLPSNSLLAAMAIELLFGSIGLFFLLKKQSLAPQMAGSAP